jgi:hypothetical protein
MNTPTTKPQITSVEEALVQFERKINPLLLMASDEIRNEITEDINQAIETGGISKRKTRRQLYSSAKKATVDISHERQNPSPEIEDSLLFGEDFTTAHEEIRQRFTNVNIKNVNGGMM